MPRKLLQRIGPDSIREFRLAAARRYADGEVLETAGRRTAAIYLWGYAAEMTLKAAYFSAIGFEATDRITMANLNEARNAGIRHPYGIDWPPQGRFHNIRAWAGLLVKHRTIHPDQAYARPSFGPEVVEMGRIIGGLWSEGLRYHKNVAYHHEVEQVKTASGWLMDHSMLL